MAEVSAGQVARLAVLFERYHRALFRYFVSMSGDREQADDLAQEVFFRMLRYRTSYDPAHSFTAWMYQIARNAGVDQMRKRSVAEVVDIDSFALVSAPLGRKKARRAVRIWRCCAVRWASCPKTSAKSWY
jgi:RNA polymerase sigma factor (sigma-70 family)